MITIRACTPDDLMLLQIFSCNTYNETFAHLNTPANMNAYLEKAFNYHQLHNELLNPDSYFYFLYSNDDLAGYLKINESQAQTDIHDPDSIELERIYVQKGFQGKGLGLILIHKTIELAKERKKKYIWLGVWEKNEKALQFYQNNGFYEIGKHSFVMGDEDQTDFIMRKDIAC